MAAQTNTESGVPFYKIGTIGGKADAYISKDLFDEYKMKYSFPHKGEVMITCAGTVGKCIIYNGVRFLLSRFKYCVDRQSKRDYIK